MVRILKDYWFGILMFTMVFICLLFVIVIAIAPHRDADMRGFTPCTYKMAEDLALAENPNFQLLLSVFGNGYKCYFSVITRGVKQYIDGEQTTPWANYLFQPIVLDEEERVEDFSQELLDANLLDEESSTDAQLFDNLQENDDEK